MKNQTTTESATNFDFSAANFPETFNNKPESETIEFVKRKPLKGKYLNAKGQEFPESIQNEILEEIKRQEADDEDFCDLSSDFVWASSVKGYEYWDNLYENTYYPKLKNSTQQKRVELIEKQKRELISATATIDNQAATIKDLETRNDNLRSQVVTANERIEILQHENKNYESAIKVIEINYKKANESCEDFNTENKWLKNEVNNFNSINKDLRRSISEHIESRDRLASKFTNWFIFLVIVSVGSFAFNVYQLLTK